MSKQAKVRLWKNGQLKEVARTMFSSDDDFQTAMDFWAGDGWDTDPHLDVDQHREE